MKRYKLLVGTHTDVAIVRGQEVQTDYVAGDVIQSNVDLVARFPGKFELVS